jgi:hypothetical protein
MHDCKIAVVNTSTWWYGDPLFVAYKVRSTQTPGGGVLCPENSKENTNAWWSDVFASAHFLFLCVNQIHHALSLIFTDANVWMYHDVGQSLTFNDLFLYHII